MSIKKKKKLKIKNFIILIIFICLLVGGLSYIAKRKTKPSTYPLKEERHKTENDKKLKQLKNINKKIDYFNMEYLDRYIKYKEKNQNLSIEQIIKNVNMQLDYNAYENPQKAKNLNTEKILVNKHYYLSETYVPENLETISSTYAVGGMRLVNYAKEAFETLSAAATKENLSIIAMSTYRSYDYQINLYNKYVNTDGKEAADTYSGRPGHSEHQTGLAVDVYNQKESYTNFENTKEYIWMQEHAHEYGFILRFPKDKEDETGYQFESWHYRYVGKEAAKYIHKNNITLEEYYATMIKDW